MNNENGSIGSFQDEANYTVESEKKLIEIVKPNHNDEKMLPVHFLPEGKQAYDWINSQLNSQAEKNTKALESVVYKSSKLDITGDSEAEKQLLLKAAENGKLEQVKEILSKQPLLVNAKDSDGYTALHRSSYSGHINIVKYLIEKGANVDGKTDDGWRPIHCATRWSKCISKSMFLKSYLPHLTSYCLVLKCLVKRRKHKKLVSFGTKGSLFLVFKVKTV